MNHYDHLDPDQHFFVSNVYGWATDKDPHKAVEKLIRDQTKRVARGTNAILVHVPLPPDAHYEINNYVPQVEGCTKVWQGKL